MLWLILFWRRVWLFILENTKKQTLGRGVHSKKNIIQVSENALMDLIRDVDIVNTVPSRVFL